MDFLGRVLTLFAFVFFLTNATKSFAWTYSCFETDVVRIDLIVHKVPNGSVDIDVNQESVLITLTENTKHGRFTCSGKIKLIGGYNDRNNFLAAGYGVDFSNQMTGICFTGVWSLAMEEAGSYDPGSHKFKLAQVGGLPGGGRMSMGFCEIKN